MRRSFKDHIRAFCILKGYEYSESEVAGHWCLRIGRYIKVFSDFSIKNQYVLLDNMIDFRCGCVASAHELMCDVIEELMNRHEAIMTGHKEKIKLTY